MELKLVALYTIICISTIAQETNAPIENPLKLTNGQPVMLESGIWHVNHSPEYDENPHSASFLQDGTELSRMILKTNITPQWISVEKSPGAQYDIVKQIGILVTNRVLVVIHDGTTNEMVLKLLGREEWPSQRRTVMSPNKNTPTIEPLSRK